MASDLHSRSASFSHKSPLTKDQSLRSASLGPSALFTKESLNFFSNEKSLPASSDEDQHHDLHEPLDIVGALNTLQLDEELAEPQELRPKNSKSNIAAEGTISSEDRSQQSIPPMMQAQDTLTPNPPPSGTFVGIPSSLNNPALTPSTTWGTNFVPLSAPPFAYSNPQFSTDAAMLIAPFHLPDDKKSPILLDSTKSNIRISQDSRMPHFGGILDSLYVFDNLRPKDYEEARNGDGAEPTTSNAGAYGPGLDVFETQGGTYLKPANFWNQTQAIRHLNDQVPEYPEYRGQTAHRTGNVQNDNMNHANDNNYGHYNRRYNQFSSGVNVHRKMHHNRRKGEDAAKFVNAKLEDFTGSIYFLCKDQHGCRFLQRQLDLGKKAPRTKNEAPRNEIVATMIFNEIYLKIVELMVDPFGNYLIQKLFENVSVAQRLVLVKNAANDFIRIALDPHGTRALQKLLECPLTSEESAIIIKSLLPYVVSLSRDLNGNHVVQKCLQKLGAEENQFVFDAASAHCVEIATHRHGCCVLQRCLDHGSARQRKQLSLEVAAVALELLLDPFGNYVVQYVLSRGDEESVAMILEQIRANFVRLAMHKFGLNVIEKVLRILKLSDAVLDVVMQHETQFPAMLNDAYGNYVLQTSLDVASAGDLARLAGSLQPYLATIKNTPHGRRIISKIQNI